MIVQTKIKHIYLYTYLNVKVTDNRLQVAML